MDYPKQCTPGNYCGPTTGQTGETPCPEGTYSSLTELQQEADCWPCKAGFYCAGTGNSAVSGPCDAGHWCQAGAIEQAPATFTYNAATDPPTNSYGRCPHFHFCEASVGYGSVCKPGTYADSDELKADTECVDQDPGKYAHTVTTASPATWENPAMSQGTCFEGYYCAGGNAWPKHIDSGCAEGYFCVAGATG